MEKPAMDNNRHQVLQLINMDEGPAIATEENEWKKRREERNKKIKELHEKDPENEILKEMYQEVEQDEQREKRKGPSPFEYIHEAVWAAERAYNDGISYSKVCDDLIESIEMFSKIVSDKPRKSSTKDGDY